MSLEIVEPAAALPITLAEAKHFARVTDDGDDDLIESLIESATEFVEQATGRSFVLKTYDLSLRAFPCDGIIRLPRSPLQAVEFVKWRDSAGDQHDLVAGEDFFVDRPALPSTIELLRVPPRTGHAADAVSIRFTAGHLPDDESPPDPAARVPHRAKAVLKSLVAHQYEFREPVVFGAVNKVPLHIERLIDSLKIWSRTTWR